MTDIVNKFKEIITKLLIFLYLIYLILYVIILGRYRNPFGIFMTTFCFAIMIGFVYLAIELHKQSTKRIKSKLKSSNFTQYKKYLSDTETKKNK